MVTEVCLIDDAIPVAQISSIDDNKCLNSSVFQLLMNDDEVIWSEEYVRELIEKLLSNRDFELNGFVHPRMYLNHIKNGLYRPNIIIFDWDYAGNTEASHDLLLEVLKKSFALVYIYSNADHETEITSTLSTNAFDPYRETRLFKLKKSDENSDHKLIQMVNEKYADNFSFRFGANLRFAAQSAVDKVLDSFGKYNMQAVGRLLNSEELLAETDLRIALAGQVKEQLQADTDLLDHVKKAGLDEGQATELITYIASKLVEIVESSDIKIDYNQSVADGLNDVESGEASQHLWANRLYYHPADDIVRKGDIVKDVDGFYLVVSPDCQLYKHWDKNLGDINVVPIFSLTNQPEEIKQALGGKYNNIRNNGISPTSFTNGNNMPAGSFLCPFVRMPNGRYDDLIGFPKKIESLSIPKPDPFNKTMLQYDDWQGVDRIASVSEPFLSALVQHCVNNLAGFGVPDYPKIVQKVIREKTKAVFESLENGGG